MTKKYFIVTSILIIAIIGTFIFALTRSNDPLRLLVTNADYLTDGEVSFVEIGIYSESNTKNNIELVNQILEKQNVKYAFYNYGDDNLSVMYSEAVECSSFFNKRKEMHDFIRANQPNKAELFSKANDLKFKIGTFQECLETKRPYELKVEQNNERISKLKLKQIPTYIINGKIYQGPMTFEAISIDIAQSKSL